MTSSVSAAVAAAAATAAGVSPPTSGIDGSRGIRSTVQTKLLLRQAKPVWRPSFGGLHNRRRWFLLLSRLRDVRFGRVSDPHLAWLRKRLEPQR